MLLLWLVLEAGFLDRPSQADLAETQGHFSTHWLRTWASWQNGHLVPTLRSIAAVDN